MNIRNHSACIGLLRRIRNAPIAIPMNAPNMGMSAVIPTMRDIKGAKGKPNMSIPARQSIPRIAASASCPERNLAKVDADSEAILSDSS